jgi:cephalosporin hydroxylase
VPGFGPGPAEALEEFLRDHGHEFEVDRGCEKFLLTFNPGGYLRRRPRGGAT